VITESKLNSFFNILSKNYNLPIPEKISFIAAFRTAYITYPDIDTLSSIFDVILNRNTLLDFKFVKEPK
jgi:hypothetical protein